MLLLIICNRYTFSRSNLTRLRTERCGRTPATNGPEHLRRGHPRHSKDEEEPRHQPQHEQNRQERAEIKDQPHLHRRLADQLPHARALLPAGRHKPLHAAARLHPQHGERVEARHPARLPLHNGRGRGRERPPQVTTGRPPRPAAHQCPDRPGSHGNRPRCHQQTDHQGRGLDLLPVLVYKPRDPQRLRRVSSRCESDDQELL